MDLPYNLEAEKQVLANMLFSSDILVETLTRLSDMDFYAPEHRIIFKTLREMFNLNQAKIEPFTLIDQLSVNGTLDSIGSSAYILQLADAYNDISNAKYYINAVEERSILRQLILNANTIVNKWKEESSGDIVNYINKIEKEMTEIAKRRRVEDFVSISAAINSYTAHVQSIKSGHGRVEGIMTGYDTFDRLLLGFKPGELNILAARPSVGKSAFALNLLVRSALRTSKPCVFFSLEMGIDSIVNRILSFQSGVPIRKIQTAQFDKDEEAAINKTIRDLSNCNLYIDETPAIKVVDMRAKLNKLQSRHGDIGFIVVDYIGLITPDVRSKKDNRSLELGEISAALKALARDFKAPILVLSQLNRGVEDRKDQVPQLSDLRESGAIEQDADIVMFIHRPDYGQKQNAANSQQGTSDPNAASDSPTSIIIAKNRNGRLATIEYMFQKHIGRFVEMDQTHS